MRYKKGNEKKHLINNEIVRVRDNRKRDLFTIFVIVFAAAALLLFYLWQRLGNVELAYKIDNLKKEYSAEQEKNNSLQLQYESLGSLDRILQIASAKLGMVVPQKNEIFITRRMRVRPEAADADKLAYTRKRNERFPQTGNE